LENRCTYVVGDMFKQVPPADAYSLQRILHDWSDPDYVRILSIYARPRQTRGESSS
jgi:O-methyltransferase domain